MSTSPVLGGTRITYASGSTTTNTAVSVDLDAPDHEFQQDGADYYPTHANDVSTTDRQDFTITFSGVRHAYSWVLDVSSISSEGKAVDDYVDTAGHLYQDATAIPSANLFRVTGEAPHYQVDYVPTDDGFTVKTS